MTEAMFLPSFRGIPKPEVFLNKFKTKDGRIIFWCHTGLIGVIEDWCKANNVLLNCADIEALKYRGMPMPLSEFKQYVDSWEMSITPRDYQYEAAYKILCNRQSLSQLATRAGKTLIAYMIFRYMLEHSARKILMIVPSIQLVKQGVEDFGKYLNKLFTIDALFLNEDRHTHNIAVLMNSEGKFEYCPIFQSKNSAW